MSCHDQRVQELGEDFAIREGGWDPRCAKVLAIVQRGDIAAVLMDPNGDGADISLDQYSRGPDGQWLAGNSGGGAGDEGLCWSQSMVAAYGRADPGQVVHLDYVDEPHTVTANGEGWWVFIAPPVDEESMPDVRWDRMRADRQ